MEVELRKKPSKFEKKECLKCHQITWHFNGECDCDVEKKPLISPKKPIFYTPSQEIVRVGNKVLRNSSEHLVDLSGGLRSRWIPRGEGPRTLTSDRCIGCGLNVVPGKVRTGSVLGNLQHFSVKDKIVSPIEGEIEFCGNVHRFVYKTEEIEITKKVAFRKRHKGHLCDKCAANCRTLTDKNGEKHLLVKTDPTPGFFERKQEKFFQHETSVSDPLPPLGGEQVDVRCYRAFNRMKESKGEKKDSFLNRR